MGGSGSEPSARDQLRSEEELAVAWDIWSVGDVVHCVADDAPVALNVDATVATYRFVCTHCGTASPWFEVSNGELILRPSSMHLTGPRPSLPDI